MPLPLSFFATILGGVIAGVVGLSSTYISRRLERRDRHLEDHMENFRIINIALVEMMNEIWPFHYGPEELRLGNPEFDQEPRIPSNGLLGVQAARPLPDKNSIEVMKIDMILFRDMKNHFTRLVDAIELFEKSAKVSGTKINEILYRIS